jgi:MFS family permease
MMRRPRAIDYLTINVYWLALSYLSNSMGVLIQPVLVAALVPEAVKGTALGVMNALGLVVAIVIQPMMGAISDRSTTRWGRRRPYILLGTSLDLVFLTLIGLAGSYWLLFAGVLLLQFASNTAHGPLQGLIPDLVPEERRGRAVGVKQVLEIVGMIAGYLVSGYFLARGQTWLALGIIMAVLALAALFTVSLVREEPSKAVPTEPLLSHLLRIFNIDLKRYPDFAWWVLSRLFILLGMNLVRNYAVYYLGYLRGLSEAEAAGWASVLMGVIAVGIAIVSYPAGRLTDRVGRKPLNILSGMLGAFGAFLFLFAKGQTLFLVAGLEVIDLLAYGAVIGLSAGIFLSANWVWAIDLVPQDEAGRYLGVSNLATAGAGVVAGLVGGPLIDLFNGLRPGLGYTAVYLTAVLTFIMGTALLFKVRETREAAFAVAG